MKHIIVLSIGTFFLFSCGKSKKEETVKKSTIETKKSVVKTPKTKNVIVDEDGVANVLFITNDLMKFNIKKFTVKAGQKVKLTLKHTGKLDKKVMGHNVVILNKDVKLASFASQAAAAIDNDYIPERTSDVLAHTKMIGGGEETTIEFTAPEKGIYDYICSFPAHFAMMKGKVIVQ